MQPSRRRWLAAGLALTLAAGSAAWWHHDHRHFYLDGDTREFAAMFAAPPAADSPATRRELDEMLQIQDRRTPADAAAAQADRKTDISRFHAALGFPAGREVELPAVRRLVEHAEDDIRPYVRAAKKRFRRLRPYEIEPRLHPCIGDVQGDLSYPSGHATYGYVMALLLAEMVPERRDALLSRADEFARQRVVCGVHFPSDLAAGRIGAEWLVQSLQASAEYARDAGQAAQELRAALRVVSGGESREKDTQTTTPGG